jgi:fructokinase
MKKVICIGEALIDFIPYEKGVTLKRVSSFLRVPGGAPLNVAATVSKLGGKSKILTKLGSDAFGDVILDAVKTLGVDISSVLRTNLAKTALAFVSLDENGERDFSFYRNPSADMLLDEKEINSNDFEEGDILHFCSVSLIDAPIKNAHSKAIEYCKAKNGIISFDPNIRLPLWNSEVECRRAILEFLPRANILKISDEELKFITEIQDEKTALNSLFKGNVAIVIYTKGSNGAEFIVKDKKVCSKGFTVKVFDTTGAGDSFIGAFLYQIASIDLELLDILALSEEKIKEILNFSNATAAMVVCKRGAIDALPQKEEVDNFMKR